MFSASTDFFFLETFRKDVIIPYTLKLKFSNINNGVILE